MKGSRHLIDSKIARISKTYADKKNITIDTAMALFIGSQIYKLLLSDENGLYLEVFEYVYDLFLEERGELKHAENDNS